MSQEDFQPGQIWPGTAISASVLEGQWTIEFQHQGEAASLSEATLSETCWIDLEWNAREALHLNAQWPGAPKIWRHLFLPQEGINSHLLRSLRMLLNVWEQWTMIPQVRSANQLPPASECRLRLKQAAGRLEAAESRQDSLRTGKQVLRQFSVRQWRIYQHVSAYYQDLSALVDSASAYGSFLNKGSCCGESARDIEWHTAELLRHVGDLASTPKQGVRLTAPRLYINQLMGASCLYHASLLKSLMHVTPVCESS